MGHAGLARGEGSGERQGRKRPPRARARAPWATWEASRCRSPSAGPSRRAPRGFRKLDGLENHHPVRAPKASQGEVQEAGRPGRGGRVTCGPGRLT